VLSHSMLQDPAGVASAARDAVVPDVLRHVPYEALHGMWELALPLVVDGGTPQDFFRFLARLGKAEAELGAVRLRHARYWDQALAMVRDAGGVERPVEDAVRRSVQVLPRLWG
jgi:hypothetical protein